MDRKFKFALLGCGRIGNMYAHIVRAFLEQAEITYYFDSNLEASRYLAECYQGSACKDVEEVFANEDIDAVLIASATPSHAIYIERAVATRKAVFCEKPIDLSLKRVELCKQRIKDSPVPIQIGFNRRFDSGHQQARIATRKGNIGEIRQVIITSRDPAPPPQTYIRTSGGIIRDMSIHDLDIARYMLDEEPVNIFAVATRFDDVKFLEEMQDFDTLMFVLTTESGKQCHINNSRVSAYGYDQRIEIFGSKGKLISGNKTPHELLYANQDGVFKPPYLHFFIERYQESFVAAMRSFMKAVAEKGKTEVDFEDGRKALILAEAAYLSLHQKRVVNVSEVTAGRSSGNEVAGRSNS